MPEACEQQCLNYFIFQKPVENAFLDERCGYEISKSSSKWNLNNLLFSVFTDVT